MRVRDSVGTMALVAFILVDAVLVTLAYRHVYPSGPEPRPNGSPTVSSSPTAAPGTPEASATGPSGPATGPATPASASASSTPARTSPAAPPVHLSVAADGTLLRATRGSCGRGRPPVVEVSTDGGGSFSRIDVGADLAEVLRVQADGADALSLVGADGSCELGTYTGGAAGRAWDRVPGTSGQWHLLADQHVAGVHAPDGPVGTPCVPVSLSVPTTSGPRVLCETTILGTPDEGASWLALGKLDDAVAIQFISPGDGYALVVRKRCSAAVLKTADGGTTWQRLTCLPGENPISIAADGDRIAAQVDGTVHVSTDLGQTWRPGSKN